MKKRCRRKNSSSLMQACRCKCAESARRTWRIPFHNGYSMRKKLAALFMHSAMEQAIMTIAAAAAKEQFVRVILL